MVSLIIPSYNPALKLPQTLDALIPQHALIDELIVVADKKNFTDGVKTMLLKYSSVFNLKIVIQEISGRGKSRNKGAEASKGELLIFLDDDMLAENELMEKHIKYHHIYPGVIVSGNGFRNPAGAVTDFGKFLIETERKWRKIGGGVTELTFKNFNFSACNMSISQKIFREFGGFDTRFSDGEDFDLAVRAINSGVRVIYDANIIAWHNDWPEFKTFIGRQLEYAEAKKEIITVHPDYLQHFPQFLTRATSASKKFLGALFKLPLVWFITSGNRIFAVLPLKIKFMLYNFTIALSFIPND